ncbi:MAG: hypothetical protein IT454_18645 [Planctomycetes bacterium]|nr:hypothetical protein [Planctomycetota bacterium]
MLLCDSGSSAIAVDDAGGRVFIAQGATLKRWNYGGAANSAVTLGTVLRAGGGVLEISGLAFGGGRLFASVAAVPSIYEISLATLVATPFAVSAQHPGVEGLSFDASSGMFYASEKVSAGSGYAGNVYSLDLLGTGALTFLAQLPGIVDTACVGNGVVYAMAEVGGAISTYDLATGVFDADALIAPWPYGVFAAGSEYAPSLVPPASPRIYCHATGPVQCAAVLTTTGAPSASAGSGFLIHHQRLFPAALVHPHFSLTGRAQLPFQSGLRCVTGQAFRLAPVLTNAGQPYCTQSLALDFNAVIASGANPGLVVGQTVWYQATVLPPATVVPRKLGFTSGVEFTIAP